MSGGRVPGCRVLPARPVWVDMGEISPRWCARLPALVHHAVVSPSSTTVLPTSRSACDARWKMSLTALVGRALRAAASDVTPLRESVAFRRLFAGQTVSQVGTQVTRVAVPLQVYAITHSSLDVGLIGAAGFVPLVVFGLYGGSIADAVDRRKLVLLTSTGAMLVSVVLLVQAVLEINRVSVLFGCVAVQSAFAAVDSPAP